MCKKRYMKKESDNCQALFLLLKYEYIFLDIYIIIGRR